VDYLLLELLSKSVLSYQEAMEEKIKYTISQVPTNGKVFTPIFPP